MLKFAGWAFVFLLVFSSTLHALDVTVTGSFKILDVTRAGGKIILPLERNQYANIRLLTSQTYRALSACAEPCVVAGDPITPTVDVVRPARTREGMWIAEVNFLPAWRMTFLVFKKGENLDVKFPAHVVFINPALEKRTRELVLQAVTQELK